MVLGIDSALSCGILIIRYIENRIPKEVVEVLKFLRRFILFKTRGYSGHSSKNGFVVFKEGICFFSRGFRREVGAKVNTIYSILPGLLFFLLFSVYLYLNEQIFLEITEVILSENWVGIFVIILWIIFLSFIFYLSSCFLSALLFWSRDLREYHACEHKLVCVLSRKIPLSMKNLKKAPRVSLSCGSIKAVLGFSVLFFLFFRIFFDFVASACLWFFLFLFCLWFFQFFFATANPSEEKLKETLGLGVIIRRILGND